MTRRAFARAGTVLSLDGYIRHATEGLPKPERLDAAAELRVHLLEQISVLEAKGFAREEAEFLAVQAMGAVRLGSRSLLSRTRILGWTVLGLMSLATGGWWVYNNLMPPREGIEITDINLTPDDMRILWNTRDAPHGPSANYNSAILTYSKATKSVYYAYITPDSVVVKSNPLSTVNEYDVSKRWPGSYRYQERWLLAAQEGSKACPQDWSLFSSIRVSVPALSSVYSSAGEPPYQDLNTKSSGGPVCSGMKLLPRTPSTPYGAPNVSTGGALSLGNDRPYEPLPLNRWTILKQLIITAKNAPFFHNLPPNYKYTSIYLAVLPSDQAASPNDSGVAFKRGVNGKITNLTYGGQLLPDLPASDWAEFMRNLPEMP
jgi:hypothetical protein